MRFEFLIILLTCLTLGSISAQNNSQIHRLGEADSLFKQEKFTQALNIYESLHEENLVSPAMLLKMAYIHEALKNYDKTNFYLYQYSTINLSHQARHKITDIAKKEGFRGYSEGNFDWIFLQLSKYRDQSIILILFLTFLVISFNVYMQFIRKERHRKLYLIQIILVFLLLTCNNVTFPKHAMLVAKNNYLMTAPSAAADVVHILGSGHKVTILEQRGVWTKIKMDENTYYIRNESLKNF